MTGKPWAFRFFRVTSLGAVVLVFCMLSQVAQAADSFAFPVRTVRLDGVSVFRDGDISPFAQEVVGREVTLAQLEQVADRITAFYRASGYPFAYAYVPPQEISDGAVVIAVEEGRYAAVVLENQSKLQDETARRLLGPVQPGAIIEEQSLTWAMRRLDGAAGVTARAAFRSTGDPGTADLVVTILDAKLFTGAIIVANDGNENTGILRATATSELHNVTGRGDRIGMRFVSSSGLFTGRIAYALPSFMRGGQYYWSAAYTGVRYELGGPFTLLESRGATDSLQIMLQGPGRALGAVGSGTTTLADSLSGTVGPAVTPHRVNQLGYEYRVHQTSVFGVNTPWHVHAFSAEQSEEWPLRRPGGIDRYSAGVTLGYLHSPDPLTAQHDAADVRSAGLYARLNVDLSWRLPLTQRLGMHASASGQWASKNLHSSEEFAIGGPSGVRAYAAGEASGDEGWLARLELQQRLSDVGLTGAVFVDGGGIRVNKKPWNASSDISESLFGAGLGLTLAAGSLQASVEYAWPLGVGSPGDGGRMWARATWSF